MHEISFIEQVSTEILLDGLDKKLFRLHKRSSGEVVLIGHKKKCESDDKELDVDLALVSRSLIDLNSLPEDVRSNDVCWAPIGYYELMHSDYDFIELNSQLVYPALSRHIHSSLALSENDTVYEYVGFSEAYVQFFQRGIRDKLNEILKRLSNDIGVFFFIEHCFKTDRHRFVFVVAADDDSEIGLVQEKLGDKFVVMHYEQFSCKDKIDFLGSLLPHLFFSTQDMRLFLSITHAETKSTSIIDLNLAHKYNPISGFDQPPLTEQEKKRKERNEHVEGFIILLLSLLFFTLYFIFRQL